MNGSQITGIILLVLGVANLIGGTVIIVRSIVGMKKETGRHESPYRENDTRGKGHQRAGAGPLAGGMILAMLSVVLIAAGLRIRHDTDSPETSAASVQTDSTAESVSSGSPAETVPEDIHPSDTAGSESTGSTDGSASDTTGTDPGAGDDPGFKVVLDSEDAYCILPDCMAVGDSCEAKVFYHGRILEPDQFTVHSYSGDDISIDGPRITADQEGTGIVVINFEDADGILDTTEGNRTCGLTETIEMVRDDGTATTRTNRNFIYFESVDSDPLPFSATWFLPEDMINDRLSLQYCEYVDYTDSGTGEEPATVSFDRKTDSVYRSLPREEMDNIVITPRREGLEIITILLFNGNDSREFIGRVQVPCLVGGMDDAANRLLAQYYDVNFPLTILSEEEAQAQGWKYKTYETGIQNEDGSMETVDHLLSITGYTGTKSEVYVPLVIGDSVVYELDSDAIHDNDRITFLSVPMVTHIRFGAVHDCSNLSLILLDNEIRDLYDQSFYNLPALTSLRIPDSLEEEMHIPVTKCENFTEYQTDDTCRNYYAEDGVLYTKDQKELVAYPMGKKENIFYIPDGVETIADCAFWNSSLPEIYIPASVTEIRYGAFMNCTDLKAVDYGGSESDWEKISIDDDYNDAIRNAAVMYDRDLQ